MAHATVVDVAVLRRRSHPHPRRGGCLVEVASTLPGGVWTDRPACVDPVLAAAARAVNDHTRSDVARRRLLVLAPWLVTGGRAGGDGTAAPLGGLAGRLVLGRVDGPTSARVAASVATLQAAPVQVRWPRWRRWRRWRRQRRAVGLVRLAARVLSRGPDADAALFALLAGAVNVTRDLDGLPPLDAAVASGEDLPQMLPVLVEVRAPDGAESMYYHCTALTDRWPAPLRTAWQARMRELAASSGVRPAATQVGAHAL